MSGVSIPANAPVGGISFTKPPATAVSYYKLATNIPITIGWNLTSLYVTPTSLTFSAFCSSNGNTYPVGPTSVPGTVTELTWTPWTYQTGAVGVQTPLIQGTYTLQVQDERGTTALGSPGLFQYNDQMTFAFYTPQPYTPLSEWQCASCQKGAAGMTQPHPALFGIVAATLIMLLSGWGLLRSFFHRTSR
ncbi:uncharacterized protein EI90DRAFT_3071792 [Cantharellus anzutake]|uniref:uncharacterized protein n=1 Tax=Cantharellus anzutake TaxID=1750568 RepID=UPI001903A983|nr:uncharacterized protein EI90DRAFT_3071792 [Cantharellus anzutake]KAF8325804.1 hypothetical protein EI90DRAFT_3071792 [Cantharellus anzutake]